MARALGVAGHCPQERLDSTARDGQGGIVGVSGQGQAWDWMILWVPSSSGYSMILCPGFPATIAEF